MRKLNLEKRSEKWNIKEPYKKRNGPNFKNELIGKNISYLIGNLDKVENEFINDPGSKAAYNIALYDAFCKSLWHLWCIMMHCRIQTGSSWHRRGRVVHLLRGCICRRERYLPLTLPSPRDVMGHLRLPRRFFED